MTVWPMRSVRVNQMVQGRRVGGPLPAPFFVIFLFFFSSYYSSTFLSLFLSFMFLFLALGHADPAVAEVGYSLIIIK